MPTIATLAVLLMSFAAQLTPAPRPEWDDTTVLHVNTAKPHATMMVYPSADLARLDDPLQSPWFQSLNGTWKFMPSPRPSARPIDFYRPDFNDGSWRTITVPGNVETQGYGMPIYVNIGYAFQYDRQDPHPPHDDNPVASYRRTFTVPAGWNGRRVLLHFAGVDSAFYAWVNGHKIGYSEDSRTPAEFDITPYLKAGSNLLAVEVYRFGDGAYLEDQDMWRMSGIFRDVYLWSTPEQHLRDFQGNTNLDDQYRDATLVVKGMLANASEKTMKVTVTAALYDAAGAAYGKPATGT